MSKWICRSGNSRPKKISGIEPKIRWGRTLFPGYLFSELPALQKLGIPAIEPVEAIANHFTEIVKRYADEI